MLQMSSELKVKKKIQSSIPELSVGDEVVISGETRTIATITSRTVATVTAAFGSDLANDTTPDCNPTALVDVIIN